MTKKQCMTAATLIAFALLTGCGSTETARETANYQPVQSAENTVDETQVEQEAQEDDGPVIEIEETGYRYDIEASGVEAESDNKVNEANEEVETEDEVEAEDEVEEDEVFIEEQVEPDAEESQPAGEFGSLEDIKAACSTRALCETDKEASVIKTGSANRYDVIYDYGEAYDAYVDACDWSLVFDADFYAETFPMLALQYHYDEDLLLMHFQTVGVHEGRQGSADFNVVAYGANHDELQDSFGRDYAAYYIYYMLNHDAEKSVNTVKAENGKEVYKQYRVTLTWYQKKELEAVNKYREEAGVDAVVFDPEMAAFANYRAYLNANDGYQAHDWLRNSLDADDGIAKGYIRMMVKADAKYAFAENTITVSCSISDAKHIAAGNYYDSKGHREAMQDAEYAYIGISNMLFDNEGSDKNRAQNHSQFDVFMTDDLATPMNHD